jgi:hypothetical protein
VRNLFLERRIGINNQLRQPVVIAQINECHAAVIALIVHPAGEFNLLVFVLQP